MPTIQIPVKPYVHRFLELNFGSPANLSKDKSLQNTIRKFLSKNNPCSLSGISDRYSMKIKIIISDDDFYRYGFEMSEKNIRNFGHIVEFRAKFFMNQMVLNYSMFMNQKDAILKFQNRFGFSEDIWPYESIKKNFYRAGIFHDNILDEVISKFEKKTLENLSELGTIEKSLLIS